MLICRHHLQMHAAGAGVIGEYDRCAFRAPGTGSFRGSAASNPTVGMAGARLLNVACRTILNTAESDANFPFGVQVHDRRNFFMWRAASSERNWADPPLRRRLGPLHLLQLPVAGQLETVEELRADVVVVVPSKLDTSLTSAALLKLC